MIRKGNNPQTSKPMKAGRFKPMFSPYKPCSPDSDAQGQYFLEMDLSEVLNEMTFSGVNLTRIR